MRPRSALASRSIGSIGMRRGCRLHIAWRAAAAGDSRSGNWSYGSRTADHCEKMERRSPTIMTAFPGSEETKNIGSGDFRDLNRKPDRQGRGVMKIEIDKEPRIEVHD